MNLVKYEATRQALIECATVDEVKTIKDKAQALANYARLSKDNELEKRSVEIRERARIRLGEMSLALPKAQGKRDDLHESTSLQDGNEVRPKVKALADAGITKAEAHRAEKLAKKSKESQEAHVAKAVEAVEKRNNHVSLAEQFTGEMEWYTPAKYIESARARQWARKAIRRDPRKGADQDGRNNNGAAEEASQPAHQACFSRDRGRSKDKNRSTRGRRHQHTGSQPRRKTREEVEGIARGARCQGRKHLSSLLRPRTETLNTPIRMSW